MLLVLKRITKSGWKLFWQEKEIAFATVFVLFISVFLIASLFVLKDVSSFLISSLKRRIDISVYFKDEAKEEDILHVKSELLKLPEVRKVVFVSKEEALEQFKERHKTNPVLMESLEAVGENPFLPSLSIQAKEAGQYGKIVNFLKSPAYADIIEKIDYLSRKPVIEKVFSLTALLKKTGIALAVSSVFLSILVTFSTIRLAILNASEEIKIQRLVGASNNFIRGPFLVQGMLGGIISALLAFFLLFLLLFFAGPKFEVLFPGLNLFLFFKKKMLFIFLVQLFSGIGLGIVSSIIAMGRYLKI